MIELPYLPPPLPDDRRHSTGRYVAAGVLLLVMATVGGCFSALIPVGYAVQARQAAAYAAMTKRTANAPPAVNPPPRTSAAATPTTATASPVSASYYIPPPPRPMPVNQLVATVGVYVTFTVGCVWLGVAALRKRRYVRPVLIVLSTHGILFGCLMCVGIAIGFWLALKQINAISAAGSGSPSMSVVATGLVVGGFVAALAVLVPPVVLLILMRPDAARETAEFYDLKSRWTDGLPLRVLGLVLTLAVFAVFELIALSHPVLPMLTHFITGLPAGAMILAHAALLAWATVRVYRRDTFGWNLGFWAVVVPMTFFLASTFLIPTERYFDTIRDQPEAIEMMRDHVPAFRAVSTGFTLVLLAAFVIYMLRVRPLVALPAAGDSSPTVVEG